MIFFMLVFGSGFFAFAHSFRDFLSHLGGKHFRMACHHFTAIREARVADGEEPKEGGDPNSDYRQHADECDAVEDGVEDKAAPFLASEEIHGRDEDEAEVDHVIFFLIVWFGSQTGLLNGSNRITNTLVKRKNFLSSFYDF
jgi:hypothetical protein